MYPTQRKGLDAYIFETQVNSVFKKKHFPKGRKKPL